MWSIRYKPTNNLSKGTSCSEVSTAKPGVSSTTSVYAYVFSAARIIPSYIQISCIHQDHSGVITASDAQCCWRPFVRCVRSQPREWVGWCFRVSQASMGPPPLFALAMPSHRGPLQFTR